VVAYPGPTLISGGLTVYGVYRKNTESAADKAESIQTRANIRRINNMLIANTGGLTPKNSLLDFWFTVIDDGGSADRSPPEEIAGPGDNGKWV
jgi:hypothetical protein